MYIIKNIIIIIFFKGWNSFGLVTIVLALAMAMFPRSLPRATQRNIAAAAAKGHAYVPKQKERRSLAGIVLIFLF